MAGKAGGTLLEMFSGAVLARSPQCDGHVGRFRLTASRPIWRCRRSGSMRNKRFNELALAADDGCL